MPYTPSSWGTPYPVDTRGNSPRVQNDRNYRYSRADDATVPTAQSASASAATDAITVVFDQNVIAPDAGVRPNSHHDGLLVRLNGALASITSVTSATVNLTVTLTDNIVATDIVTIEYRGGGVIQAAGPQDPPVFAPYFYFEITAGA